MNAPKDPSDDRKGRPRPVSVVIRQGVRRVLARQRQ